MDKMALRDMMLSLEVGELHALEKNYTDLQEQARLEQNESFDEDGLSHALENSTIAELFEQPLQGHREKIDALGAIDFSPKTVVEEGAAVKFNGRYYVISVATSQFTYHGESFMGISTEAPIYEAIQGLEVGDRFEFNGGSFVIQAVY